MKDIARPIAAIGVLLYALLGGGLLEAQGQGQELDLSNPNPKLERLLSSDELSVAEWDRSPLTLTPLAARAASITSLAAGVPVEGNCTGESNSESRGKPVEICAEYAVEVLDLHLLMLITLELPEQGRNVHIGVSPLGPISEGVEYYAVRGFGEPLEYTSERVFATRKDVLETGTFYIAVINFESSPIEYELTASLSPIELTSGVPHVSSIVDNTNGGRFPPTTVILGPVDYFIQVSGGAPSLTIELENHNLDGDIDLFARFDKPVDLKDGDLLYDYESTGYEGIESIEISSPEPGTYWIRVANYEPERQVFTLTATVEGAEAPPNQPPEADFIFEPADPTTEDSVQFTDRSRDPDGEIIQWQWDFGDGTTSSEQNPTHRYTQAGTYTVRLTVTDDGGLTDTVSKTIIVITEEGPPPPAPPTGPLTVDPTSLSFQAQVNGPNPDPRSLTLTNTGDRPLMWEATIESEEGDWLFLSFTGGTLPAGGSVPLQVMVDITGLAAGTYQGTLTFLAPRDPEVPPVTVPVTLTITPPKGEEGEGDLLALKFVVLEFLRPADWERNLRDGCVVYTNISAGASPIRVTLPDGSTQEYAIPAGREVIVCGDVVHIDTRS